MADPADMVDAIATQATEPISSASDGQSVTSRPVEQMLKAVQAVEMRAAVRKRRRGLTFTKLIPAGPMPDGGAGSTGFDRAGGV